MYFSADAGGRMCKTLDSAAILSAAGLGAAGEQAGLDVECRCFFPHFATFCFKCEHVATFCNVLPHCVIFHHILP